MRQWMVQILAMALALSTLAMPVFAAGFTDADGDGLCDNRGQSCGYVDADLDGICDNRSDNRGLCRLWIDEEGRPCQGLQVRGGNFVDADEDGVCDNFGTGCQGKGQGRGSGKGYCR